MEIVEKVKTAIGLAEEDLDLHVKNLKEGADRFFRIVDGMIKDYYNVETLDKWYSYLPLDHDEAPNYEIIVMAEKSQKFDNKIDFSEPRVFAFKTDCHNGELET